MMSHLTEIGNFLTNRLLTFVDGSSARVKEVKCYVYEERSAGVWTGHVAVSCDDDRQCLVSETGEIQDGEGKSIGQTEPFPNA